MNRHRTGRTSLPFAFAILASLFLIVTAPVELATQENDDFDEAELFAEIFGANGDQDLVVPVYRNGEFLGEVQTLLSGNGQEVRIGGAAFELVVEPFLNAAALAALDELIGDEALIGIEAFEAAGLTLVYGPEEVELRLSIAPDRLREREIGAERRAPPPNLQQPVDFSGYTNLLARGVVSSLDEGDTFFFGFEPVLNYRGWVAEASMGFSTAPLTQETLDDDPFSLRYARLVRDFPEQQIRGEAGLVRYQRGALFNGPEILGFSATRLDEIDPDTPLFRSEDIRFVVPRYAPVEIYLNERRYRRDNLNEGPYVLPDIPLGRGISRVRVVQDAEDDEDGEGEASQVVLLEEQFTFSPQLLRPGRHLYSGGLGMLRNEYSADALFFSGLYRFGLLPRWTVGADSQASLEQYALGLHSLVATGYGITRAESALSLDQGGSAGVAAEVSHMISLLHTRRWPVVEVTGLVESPDYQRVHAPPREGGRLRGGLSLNQRLPGAVSATLGVIHSRPLTGDTDPETSLRVSLSHQSPRGYAINMQVSPTFAGGEVEWAGGVFIRFGSPDRRLNTVVNYDLVNETSSLEVSNVPTRAFGAFNWSARYERSAGVAEDTHQVGGTVQYDMYRGSAQLQPEFLLKGESENEARLSAQYATALAWAGQTVAVTRPVRDSFAIFVPLPSLEGETVPLRPAAGAVTAELSGRAAVVPDLASWTYSTVRVDGSRLPDGLSVGERDVSFFPGYRSGYIVVVGSAATVYATGRLVDGEGRPLGLEAGEVFRLDEEDPEDLFFTNREGFFEIPDLRPGQYRLTLFSHPDVEAEFVIPAGERGEYILDDVIFLTGESP
ncbi:MAG: hypothetical protein EA427_08705 [Spirochaetaceae bacterium]|nr:MAG: hypothetical protein EA427_08705 [Spirochaetaceae bacterium]